VLVLPAEWPHPRLNHWRTLVQARAIEDQFFVIACNCIGESSETTFCGHSLVVDPWGELVCEAGEAETMLTVTINTDEANNARSKMPVLDDRRPHLYGS
jgi:omega-amidase